MREVSSTACTRSLSEGGRGKADARLYLSTSGEFNYYPTSTHKRQLHKKVVMDENGSSSAGNRTSGRVVPSPARDTCHHTAVSPSSAGLSRSPSQLSPTRQSAVAQRSLSQPLSAAPEKTFENRKPLSVTVPMASGAPLLHRYRTSQVGLHRSRSQGSTSPLSVVDRNAAKSVTSSRRSLLPSPAAAKSASTLSTAAAVSRASASVSVPASGTEADLVRPKSSGFRATFLRARNTPASPDAVPVACVRLVDTAHSGTDTQDTPARKDGASYPHLSGTRTDQEQQRASSIRTTLPQPSGEAGMRSCQASETTAQRASPSLSKSHLAEALLSRDASGASVCPDDRCVHSEQSICEFIAMQRELRRCYTAMGDYEAVVAELRQECADAWAALHQLQRQCIQREREVEAAVRAEVTGELMAQRQNGDDAAAAAADVEERRQPLSSGGETESDCVETACREAVDELRRALQEEKTAHADCRRQLVESRSAESHWEACAAELLRWRGRVRQKEEESAPRSIDAAHECSSSTPARAAHVSPSLGRFSVAPENSPGLSQASSLSSPAPRPFSPPHPHQARTTLHLQGAPAAGGDVSDLSCLSALSNESFAVARTESHVKGEAADGDDGSALSTSGASTASHGVFSGETAQAVGSGVVLIESRKSRGIAGKRDQVVDRDTPENQPSAPPFVSTWSLLKGMKGANERSKRRTETRQDALCAAHFHANSVECNAETPLSLTRTGAPEVMDPVAQSRVVRTPGLLQPPLQLPPFPPPSLSNEVPVATTRGASFVFCPAREAGTAAPSTSAELSERRCKELLWALLDKERQLAEVAEERTKYRLLCEGQASVAS